MNRISVSIINKPEICDERLISSLTRLTFSGKLANCDDLREQLVDVDDRSTTMAENIFKMNHSSIAEHLTLTFALHNISRATSLEIVRHRMASYTSSSTRYIDYSKALENPADYFVTPIEIMEGTAEQKRIYKESCERSIREYKNLIDSGQKCEVARNVLPNAFRCDLIMTVNLRGLKNFLNLRLCGVTASEINYVAMLMYEEILKLFPTIGHFFVPDCACLPCPSCKQGKRIENCAYKGWTLEKMKERFKILNN